MLKTLIGKYGYFESDKHGKHMIFTWGGGVTEGRRCSKGIEMIKGFIPDTESTSNVLNMFLSSLRRSICGM